MQAGVLLVHRQIRSPLGKYFAHRRRPFANGEALCTTTVRRPAFLVPSCLVSAAPSAQCKRDRAHCSAHAWILSACFSRYMSLHWCNIGGTLSNVAFASPRALSDGGSARADHNTEYNAIRAHTTSSVLDDLPAPLAHGDDVAVGRLDSPLSNERSPALGGTWPQASSDIGPCDVLARIAVCRRHVALLMMAFGPANSL